MKNAWSELCFGRICTLQQPPPHIQYLSPYNKLLVLELKVAKLEIYAWFRSLGAATRNEDSFALGKNGNWMDCNDFKQQTFSFSNKKLCSAILWMVLLLIYLFWLIPYLEFRCQGYTWFPRSFICRDLKGFEPWNVERQKRKLSTRPAMHRIGISKCPINYFFYKRRSTRKLRVKLSQCGIKSTVSLLWKFNILIEVAPWLPYSM